MSVLVGGIERNKTRSAFVRRMFSMRTLLWIIGEIIVFGLLSFLCKKVRNVQFYESVLKHTKYPLYDLVSFKEKIAYGITKFVKDAPTFSFAPSDYEFWRKESEKTDSCKRGEKVLINISLIFLYFRSVVGNVIIDIILIITIVTCQNIIDWEVCWKSIVCFFMDIPFDIIGEYLICALKWIQENVNVILVLLIVVISAYIGLLKKKKRKYSIEAVWAEEDEEHIKEIARIQKKVESVLLDIRGDIYQNLKILQEQARFFTGEENIKFDKIIDYSKKTDELKQLMWEITNNNGIQIYAKRNRRLYVQLSMLDLLPSLTDKKRFIELDYLSLKYISNNCKNEEDMCETYARGVALMNGINRFLKFSYKKRNQYNKVVLHIADSDYLGGIIEKIK